MSLSEILKKTRVAGVDLSVVGDLIKLTPSSGSIPDGLKESVREYKTEIIQAITGEVHHTNPKTGQVWVTQLAKCEHCGYACWGEIEGNPNVWGCLVCR